MAELSMAEEPAGFPDDPSRHSRSRQREYRQRFYERLGWRGMALEWLAAIAAEMDRPAQDSGRPRRRSIPRDR